MAALARSSDRLLGDLLLVTGLILVFSARIVTHTTRFHHSDKDWTSDRDSHSEEGSWSSRQKFNTSGMFYSSFRSNYLSVPLRKEFRLHLQHRRRTILTTVSPCSRRKDHIYLLLIICAGDVELNPGPRKFPCGVCDKSVRSNQKGIQCDNYNIWFHCRCICMSTTDYNELGSSDKQWLCQACGTPVMADFSPPTNPGSPKCPPSTDPPSSPDLPQQPKSPGLHCYLLNARSIVNKLSNLQALLSTFNIDIIAITETHLSQDILDSEVCPQGYTVFRKDRNRAGGGVMFIVKDAVQAKRRYDLNPDCEMIWLELNSPKVILGVMYRPPSSGEKDLLELQATLMSIPRNTPLCLW